MQKMNLRKYYFLANKKQDTSWFFILNSLHFIVSSGDYYCLCQDNHKCKMCKILVIFSDFKMGIDKYLFDYNFLSWYYIKLVKEPIPIFYEKKECIKCFQSEFKFRGHDWYVGEDWNVSLCESIHCSEKIHLGRFK